MIKESILVIGANGQIGTALVSKLRSIYGSGSVVASDIRAVVNKEPFEVVDATNYSCLAKIVSKYKITQIYHLAAVLSAKAEADPLGAWNLNIQTLLNVFEAAREYKVSKVFSPSSIAVFGDRAPRLDTPQFAHLDPATVYGVSKVAAECWSVYYHKRYGLDIRSLRYPGVISYNAMPGGGTTDYAVEMFHKAVKGETYSCYLKKGTRLPMIYMDDAIRASLEIMEAPAESIRIRSSYNLAGLSFTPGELAASICKYYPAFSTFYSPDFRQSIADSWPETIDDSEARKDWGWRPEYNLESMTNVMVKNLSQIVSP